MQIDEKLPWHLPNPPSSVRNAIIIIYPKFTQKIAENGSIKTSQTEQSIAETRNPVLTPQP
jgi:hypothetical protein